MSIKRIALAILVTSAVLLAVGAGPKAAARASLSENTSMTIPYAGRLSDDAGQPVAEGSYAFAFALYDTLTSGQPLWSEVQDGVGVKGGSFAASLGSVTPIPPAVLDGRSLWLAVEVRGPGEVEFTALNPRQRLSAAAPSRPTANGACPHDHLGETWTGNYPLTITGDFDSGELAPLVLSNARSSGRGLRITQGGDAAVSVGSANFGVVVEAAGSDGVRVNSAGDDGVHIGTSGDDGMYVSSAGSDGLHVHSATNMGAYVESALTGFGVNSVSAYGMYVGNSGSDGLYIASTGHHGMYVGSADQDGIYVDSAGDDGLYVLKAGNPDAVITSGNKNGLEVAGAEGSGLYVGHANLDGLTVSEADWYGVYVQHADSDGVYVDAAGRSGVVAHSLSALDYGGAFYNFAEHGAGLYAAGGDNTAPDLVLGVHGSGDDGRIYSWPEMTGSDLLLFSNDKVHVHLDEDNNSPSSSFVIYNGDDLAVWTVGEKAEVTFGTEAGAYGPRATYAVRATGDWIEDFGTAELVNGQATVTIEPVFAQMVNLAEYQVFLTPLGDCSLYVADKAPASFTVKAMGGQRCNIGFDYRLVAKRLGNEQARLEPADVSHDDDDEND
jgi:hypothetical protein